MLSTIHLWRAAHAAQLDYLALLLGDVALAGFLGATWYVIALVGALCIHLITHQVIPGCFMAGVGLGVCGGSLFIILLIQGANYYQGGPR